MGGDWRSGFEYAWQAPVPEPDEGPGLTWRQLTPPPLVRHLGDEGPWHRHPRRRRLGRLLCLEDLPGLSPVTTVGRFDSVEAAQVATDEVWAARTAL